MGKSKIKNAKPKKANFKAARKESHGKIQLSLPSSIEAQEYAALASLFGTQKDLPAAESEEKKRAYEVVAVKKLFTEASPQHHFFVADGSVIRNVVELVAALEKMNGDTYSFHANEQKNDFSSWVRDVFGQHELAEDLKSAASKTEAQLAVTKRLLREFL